MIDAIVRALKAIIPDETWDFIFSQFTERKVKFDQPAYSAVRVSKNYILVRVEKQDRPKEESKKSVPDFGLS